MQLSEDDVSEALASAFQARDVPVDDDGVKVTTKDGLFELMVRLTADSQPLPQVPDDTSNLPPGSVQGAKRMVLGAVQIVDGACRVTMRIVDVETSEILEAGKGDAWEAPRMGCRPRPKMRLLVYPAWALRSGADK